MTLRLRVIVATVVTGMLLVAAAAYGVVAFGNYQQRQDAASKVRTVTASVESDAPRIVFRNTAAGQGYGLVASVPLADPGGARAMTDVACDRVYSTSTQSMCLRIDRGVVTTFSANLFDDHWRSEQTWSLPGLPSRTRVSADSKLVAFTSFVTGSSYGTVGFSTATRIARVGGRDFGNLEDFALIIDGKRVLASDRNFWGVTFGSDDNVFYATAATGGSTWLVRGDLVARTMTAVKETAECPSLSPDGSHVAYKKKVSTGATAYWSIAVLDLATGAETVLPEKRNVDDQVEWLDNGTILYGLPRTDSVGDSDVWSIAADGSSAPTLFIRHAWSPSVVR
jgi:hypothetical protein